MDVLTGWEANCSAVPNASGILAGEMAIFPSSLNGTFCEGATILPSVWHMKRKCNIKDKEVIQSTF